MHDFTVLKSIILLFCYRNRNLKRLKQKKNIDLGVTYVLISYIDIKKYNMEKKITAGKRKLNHTENS